MRCGRCGTPNPEEALFCLACGTRFAVAVAAPSRPAPSPLAHVGFRLIFVHPDGTDGTSHPLRADQIDIGRSEGDLLFEDVHLSPRHARIISDGRGQVLSALESRNGVYVRLRGAAELQDGDMLLIGKQILKFEIVSDFERNLQPAAQHDVVTFGTNCRPAWSRLRQIGPTGVSQDVFNFSRDQVVLGREQCDVVFADDQFMSRQHARLSRTGTGAQIQDLGSSNGTFLRLAGDHLLAAGDLVRMGNVLLRYEPG